MVHRPDRTKKGRAKLQTGTGYHLHALTIIRRGPSLGHAAGSEIEPAQATTSLEEVLAYLERRVQVLYAGSLGQSLDQCKVNNEAALEIINKYGTDDYSKVRELIHLIRNIKYPNDESEEERQKHLTEIENPLWDQAAALVEANHDLIEILADTLASEVKEINKEARLTKETIDRLPAIATRFGCPST